MKMICNCLICFLSRRRSKHVFVLIIEGFFSVYEKKEARFACQTMDQINVKDAQSNEIKHVKLKICQIKLSICKRILFSYVRNFI